MTHYSYYDNRLKKYARENRKNATKAEACLWKYVLRKGQLDGLGFKRQRPVGRFIADFMCQRLNLIIEVDGITHEQEDVKKRDAWRQEWLESVGFRVVRFTNHEVLTEIDEVRNKLLHVVEQLQSGFPAPRRGLGGG